MVPTRAALDWQEVYARLEQTRQRLEASSALPPAEVRRILRERAQALARPLVEPSAVPNVLELAVFVLAKARYCRSPPQPRRSEQGAIRLPLPV